MLVPGCKIRHILMSDLMLRVKFLTILHMRTREHLCKSAFQVSQISGKKSVVASHKWWHKIKATYLVPLTNSARLNLKWFEIIETKQLRMLNKKEHQHGSGKTWQKNYLYVGQVNYANFTRLNHTKPMIVVNGQFPGPPIHAHEGDTLVINVTNLVAAPVTIHW